MQTGLHSRADTSVWLEVGLRYPQLESALWAARGRMDLSARVFIHPRCWQGPAQGAVTASLETAGYTDLRLRIGHWARTIAEN